MIGLTIGKQFLRFNDIMFDGIMNNLFLDLEINCLTKENKSRFVNSFMDNYMTYLEPIFENNDLCVNEDDIDNDELNVIFNEFEEYLDWILKTDE
jgi:hypothetical protein